MEIKQYLDQQRRIYDSIISYISNDNEDEYANVNPFKNDLEFQKITEEKETFREFLRIIAQISENHHRSPSLISKIENILFNYSTEIKKNFTNSEILDLFNNKRIILFLFNHKIIIPDKEIYNGIFNKMDNIEVYKDETNEYIYCSYSCCYGIDDDIIRKGINRINHNFVYFFPEIKTYMVFQDTAKEIEDELEKNGLNDKAVFEQKRMTGENDNILCEMIRFDSVIPFITYVNSNNISLINARIPDSVFETNSFLIDKNVSLIEYAAFFGSIQIFKYLQMNGVEMNPDLWLYAIHGKNGEIIHLLEENNIKPPSDDYDACLKESIKCHHNEIATYIFDNLIDNDRKEESYANNIISYSFQYLNYNFINEVAFNHKYILHYLCKFDYYNLVKLYLKNEKIDVNSRVIVLRKSILNSVFNYKIFE